MTRSLAIRRNSQAASKPAATRNTPRPASVDPGASCELWRHFQRTMGPDEIASFDPQYQCQSQSPMTYPMGMWEGSGVEYLGWGDADHKQLQLGMGLAALVFLWAMWMI
jgi:hypothetical protein